MLDQLTLSGSLRKSLETATALFEQNLYDAKDFLVSRGITEAQARSYRYGVVTSDAPAEYERFVGMMSLPYLTPAGVVALKFRALDPERKPKYDAPSGQHARLYNVAALHSKGDTVAICEGEIDALVCTEHVGIPAVGIPGASHWLDHWSRAFSDYEEVLVIGDHDVREDGSSPGLKHARRVVQAVPGARLVLPPPGMDLNEWVQAAGPEGVRGAIGV